MRIISLYRRRDGEYRTRSGVCQGEPLWRSPLTRPSSPQEDDTTRCPVNSRFPEEPVCLVAQRHFVSQLLTRSRATSAAVAGRAFSKPCGSGGEGAGGRCGGQLSTASIGRHFHSLRWGSPRLGWGSLQQPLQVPGAIRSLMLKAWQEPIQQGGGHRLVAGEDLWTVLECTPDTQRHCCRAGSLGSSRNRAL
jgi:hypothetical protein